MDFFPGADKIIPMLPWVIGATVLCLVLIVCAKMWSGAFGRRVKNMPLQSGMQFQDIDTLRKKGLVSDKEYKEIRQALARRETQRESEHVEAERSRQLLNEVAVNPDAARKFLTPEQRAAADAGEPMPAAEAPRAAQPALQPQQAPQPSMNNPRVVAARNEARAPAQSPAAQNPQMQSVFAEGGAGVGAGAAPGAEAPAGPTGKARDIDVLLAKGAITQEEYDRLKQFFE